jgi:Sulfotransferase domain
LTRHLLLIGAQRCGTTYLAALLDAHPGVTMARPARPEPKVFLSDEILSRGVGWYRDTYFAHARPGEILGEKSTSYLEDPGAAARARAVLGRPEIVVQLRDPIDRAVSNWRFSRRHGLEDRPLGVALEDNLVGPREWDRARTSVSPFAYLQRGRYVDYLEAWFGAFADSVHVTFLDDVISRPDSVAELYAAIGVDPHYRPSVVEAARNSSEGDAPAIGPELRQRLRAYFADSDSRLADRLGRPLPWAAGDRPGAVVP